MLEMETWEKHADVCLDSPVAEYRRVLEEWIGTRKEINKTITHFSQAAEPLDWPLVPEFPLVPFVGCMERVPAQMRQEMVRRGANFLKWQRPTSYSLPLPKGQRLLATGEVVGEAAAESDGEDDEDEVDEKGDAAVDGENATSEAE